MAHVPGYKYDIFISYPREANADGWVEKYVNAFKQRAAELLPDIGIFFDKNEYKPTQHRQQMVEAAKSSAIFMPILVPAYFASRDKFTMLELDGFCRSCDGEDRIAIIEKSPVGGDRPAELHGPNRNIFYQEAPPHLELKPGTRAYDTKIANVAEGVIERLKEVAAQYRKTVLLTSATSDVKGYSLAVADDLRASGFTILPEDDYRGDRKRSEELFRADLAKADLFVQLLGQEPSADTRDPEAQHFAEFQYIEAKNVVGISVLQWAPPNVDPAKLPSDSSYRRLLEGSDARPMLLKEFKIAVKEKLKNLTNEIARPSRSASREIYIAAHRSDEEYKEKLKTVLIDLGYKGYNVLTNLDNLRDLKEVMEKAYAFVMLEGNVEREFVTNWLRSYKRLRCSTSKHPEIEALVYAPPPREDKKHPPDVGFDGLRYFLPPEAFPQKDLEDRLRQGSA